MLRRGADLVIATAAIASAAMIAACGSGSPSSSSSGGHLTQTQVQEQRDLVAFAGCMRSHRVTNRPDKRSRGFASFPDPTSTGLVSRQMLANAGINLRQPAVLPAAEACTSVTHGMITKADVARVAAGQAGS
jgi:hypothetical protein